MHSATPRVLILCIPTSVFAVEHPNTAVQVVVFSIELAFFAVVSVPVFVQQWLRTRPRDITATNEFVRIFGPVDLAVIAVLWICVLPDYVSAVDGITRDGTPVGNLFYGALCFAAAVVLVASVSVLRPQHGVVACPSDVLPADEMA
jgi:cbb3-type cytochrome oxidase subunit 1